MPPFPDAAAPLSQMEDRSQKGAKWSRLYPRRGLMGAQSSTASALSIWPHTPAVTRTREKPAQSGVHGQPRGPSVGAE